MKLSILIAHTLFGIRRFQNKNVEKLASSIKTKQILEIGSGKMVDGKYSYSMVKLFDKSNNFVMTDINPDFGHKVLDITKMQDKGKWDVILCLNVLEHVYDYNLAISNLYNALKKDGMLIVLVPGYYPLHDEPYDFWRFTEHALRKMFDRFSIKISVCGIRKYPIAYFVVAKKK
jgi:SAM-dependent methyltransferase